MLPITIKVRFWGVSIGFSGLDIIWCKRNSMSRLIDCESVYRLGI